MLWSGGISFLVIVVWYYTFPFSFQISTLEILNVEESSDAALLSEDTVFAMRQAARHVCGALKKYFEAHLAIKADEVRRSHTRNDGSSPLQETPAYKVNWILLRPFCI